MTQEDRLSELARISPDKRILLLSHCLRPSQSCPGKFDKQGLHCPDDCSENCIIRRLKASAMSQGYAGVCIAAGGAMALRFVKEVHPQGIVAVACVKELEEGVRGVMDMVGEQTEVPAIVIVPLLNDGCVDTAVDETQVLRVLETGVSPPHSPGGGSPSEEGRRKGDGVPLRVPRG